LLPNAAFGYSLGILWLYQICGQRGGEQARNRQGKGLLLFLSHMGFEMADVRLVKSITHLEDPLRGAQNEQEGCLGPIVGNLLFLEEQVCLAVA